MGDKKKPMDKKHRNLWQVVRRIIIENHGELLTHRIRESFYVTRNYLAEHIGTDIIQAEFDYFGSTKQGYASYANDIWPSLEQKHGLQRPEAKPYGTIYDDGMEFPISRLSMIWRQARGFVFTEKLEDGEDLRRLSTYGWTIIAGGGFAGFPTRQIRQMLKKDTRPILAFHDADIAGTGIYRALGFETRRTKHLDIALGDRVTDLGLTMEDAQRLNLPTTPEPPKHGDKRRVETATLALLEKTMKIENPKLAYVVARMLVLGMTLSPTEVSKYGLLHGRLEMEVVGVFSGIIDKAVSEAMSEWSANQEDPDAEAVSVSAPLGSGSKDIVSDEMVELAKDIAIKMAEKVEWSYEADWHERAKGMTNSDLVALLKGEQ